MSQVDVCDLIILLPIFLQKKIIYYYISNYMHNNGKIRGSQALHKIPLFKDFNRICYFFDKFSYNEFIQIDIKDYEFIKLKYPNINFNTSINKRFIRNMIEVLWSQVKFYYNKLGILPGEPNGFNINLAGGYFINYNPKAYFSTKFIKFYEHFQINKDVDIYYHNSRSRQNHYNNNYISIRNYQHKFNLIGFNSIKDQFSPILDFDFDICKF